MRRPALALLTACALTTGCATPAYVSPVEVTRFVGEAPTTLAQGSIEISAAPGLETDTLAFTAYAEAVGHELEQLGYRVVAEGGAQIAQIGIAEYAAAEGRRGRGVGVGAGGSAGSYGSGVGVGVGIDLTSLLSGPPPERIERLVSVAIKPVDADTNLWEGRASMVATSNSDYADTAAAAARMADALFSGFPGTSGETIEVE